MDQLEKMRSGVWHDGFGDAIGEALLRCEQRCFELNSLLPSDRQGRNEAIRRLLPNVGNRSSSTVRSIAISERISVRARI